MVKKITRNRRVSPAASPVVLGSADLARTSGGSDTGDVDALVMKQRHETAKNSIGNIR